MMSNLCELCDNPLDHDGCCRTCANTHARVMRKVYRQRRKLPPRGRIQRERVGKSAAWIERHTPDFGAYLPTPDEIVIECERIRERWTPEEAEMRKASAYRTKFVEFIRASDVRHTKTLSS
jgi:hypothetical protein